MNRHEKIDLLKAVARGKKPTLDVWIIHAPFGIYDTDRKKKLQPEQIEGYITQLQKDNPFSNVIHNTISLEKYNRILSEIEAKI